MLRHAIAPVRRYTKASHDVVRHSRLNSDAKVLLLYVQGLPESEAAAPKPLSEHAARLGLKGRAYQKAKQLLADCGYLHEWREQGARGRWVTEQLLANVTLTRDEASRAREGGAGADGDDCVPSERPPTVGRPGERTVGDSPQTEDSGEKDLPHPPPQDRRAPDADEAAVAIGEEPEPEPEAEPGSAPAPAPELAEAEGVLLSLRHAHRDLLLGVREARLLADAAAEWLRRGVSAPDLRRALTTGLPADGIRSAVGFLRHRLIQKLPAARCQVTPTPPPERTAAPARRSLVTCPGPGAEHVFRPRNDETHCLRCRTAAAFEATLRLQPLSEPWRTRVQECAAGA
ncbi:hypothetical protein FHS35_007516 [Streptomyces umbrinus]|uniref:hypothetical protein n=1 Tax=Streptomyces umbrinus TaxID=67370 RepID=UPI00167CFFAE|nr:hypothetical protein [Streptomyces umbrinus]MCR3730625.1 hypothetical protein [Streptomyces umbrinus]GHH44858.1 DNA-binding protein [Streptomyces umbrinus]